MPVLYCRHLDKRTQWKVATGESFTLGFSSAASVPVPDATLAPREVSVSRVGDRYVLRDLAERGHVLLNGMAAREGLLEDGDRVQVGRISILFLDDARVRGGEVDLFPREPGPEADARRWESLEADAELGARPGSPPAAAERQRTLLLTCAAAALIAGFAIGLFVVRVPGARQGPRAAAKAEAGTPAGEEGAAGGTSREPAGTTGGVRGEPAGGALRKIEEIRTEEGKETRPSGEIGTPARAAARLEAAGAGPRERPPSRAEAATFHAGSDASRLALHRLFLDIAERPPTREEERTLLSLPHHERFRRVLEAARGEGIPAGLSTPAASLFQLWIGRPPTAAEAREVASRTSPEHAAALWISSLPEYARSDRRRPRSIRQRARSLIVDLLDRPPAGEAEVDLVETALREPRSLEEVSRTLLHSPESRLADGPGTSWESEFFRFLLRPPAPAERAEIGRLLEGTPRGDARRRLALALVDFPEYRSY